MSTCIQCVHWQPAKTAPGLLRLGFAQCAKKKLTGHTTSAEAFACMKFVELDADLIAKRREWLLKAGGVA